MPTSRIVVWSIIGFCVLYDVLCVIFRWPTISSQVRVIDASTGGLFRWMWLALWLHWFVHIS